MASPSVVEQRPASLDATSDPPTLFDGTIRLYTSYVCPFAQRVWITINFKGLQEKIKLVPLDLGNRPDWYKEKVYPENKIKKPEIVKHDNRRAKVEELEQEMVEVRRLLSDKQEQEGAMFINCLGR